MVLLFPGTGTDTLYGRVCMWLTSHEGTALSSAGESVGGSARGLRDHVTLEVRLFLADAANSVGPFAFVSAGRGL